MRHVRRYFQWSWNEWLPQPRWVLATNAAFAVLNAGFVVLHLTAWGWSWSTLVNVVGLGVAAYTSVASWRSRRHKTWRLAMFDARVHQEIRREMDGELARRQEEASWN